MLELALGLLLLGLGFFGAFFSGLLGIGGAIVMIPLLLYVPPAFGFPTLDMKLVAGLSMVQVLFASLSGVIAHHRHEFVSKKLIVYLGSGSLVGSLAGGVASKYMSAGALSAVFAGLAAVGVALMLLPPREASGSGTVNGPQFNRALALLIAVTVGAVAGMVGAGGAFVLIPLMLYVLRIPVRTSIGSSLGIVFLGSLAGAAGKIATGQVVYPLAAALVIGALPGAQVGSRLSQRIHTRMLRLLLLAVIGGTALKMWYDLLMGS